jgi:phytochrome B
MQDTDLSEDQKQFVETSEVCERQLRKILDDMDLESIEDGYSKKSFFLFPMGLNMRLYLFGQVNIQFNTHCRELIK